MSHGRELMSQGAVNKNEYSKIKRTVDKEASTNIEKPQKVALKTTL